jgi:hypothetical protein
MNARYVWVGLLGLVGIAFVACAPSVGGGKTLDMGPQGTLTNGAASAVKGQFTITADGAKTRISVSLSNLEPNSKHAGHVHIGSCATPGPVAIVLNTITADGSGNGGSSTDVDTAKLTGSQYVAFHQRDATDPQGIGGVISCGDIK